MIVKLIAGILLVAVPSFSQIEVLTSAGVDVQKTEDNITIVEFVPKTESDVGTEIRNILAESQSMSFGTVNGQFASASGSASTYKSVCFVPCKLELPGGSYRFQAGRGELGVDRIDIQASGGFKKYEVENVSTGGVIGGILLGGMGFGLGISFIIMGAILDPGFLPAGVASIGAGVAGIVMINKSDSEFRQVETPQMQVSFKKDF